MVNPIVIDKQKIDAIAFEIVRSNGMDALSARNISKEIGCSTKPIYRIYKNMDELKNVVLNSVLLYMHEYVYMYKKTGNPLLDSGLAYINFAKNEKELFKLISMSNNLQFSENVTLASNNSDQQLFKLISIELAEKNFPSNKLREIAENLIIYTYGLAILSFLDIQNFSNDELAHKLSTYFDTIST